MRYLLVIFLVSLSESKFQTVSNPGTVIPAYWYPSQMNGKCTDKGWIAMGTSAIANRTYAIANVNSGPAKAVNAEFKACISYLRSKKVKVVGYVHMKVSHQDNGNWIQTAYRNQSDITTDINNWFKFYTIDGIFLDEVTGVWGAKFETNMTLSMEITKSTVDYIKKTHGKNQIVIMNPGGIFDPKLIMNYDSTVKGVIFEGALANWYPTGSKKCQIGPNKLTFGPGPYCGIKPVDDGQGNVTAANPPKTLRDYMLSGKIDPSQIVAMIVYDRKILNLTQSQLNQAIKYGLSQNIGNIYISDMGFSYTSLPSAKVWANQTALLSKY